MSQPASLAGSRLTAQRLVIRFAVYSACRKVASIGIAVEMGVSED
jgi:hypothetical protein